MAFRRGAELHERPGKPGTKVVAKRAVGSYKILRRMNSI
jgi:hypothetical protein